MDPAWSNEVIERLTRIEALAISTNGKVLDHEKRIRYLERLAWGFGGAIALVTTAITLAFLFFEAYK